MSFIKPLLHRMQDNKHLFEVQQRLFNNYGAVRKEFEEIFDSGSSLRILDIGCSTGACARGTIDFQKHRYIGVDIDQQYIEKAQQISPLATFMVMDARKLDFEDGSFDLVTFNGVMHHMDDTLVKDCLRESARVLANHGRVIAAEPVYTPTRWISTQLLKMDRGNYIRDKDGYQALFEGFAVERQRFFNFSLHRFCSFILAPIRR